MYRILIAMAVLLVVGMTARADTIEMTVNGLVCSFCAQGIEKALRQKAATQDVLVSLEHKLVAVATKEGLDIPDAELTRALTEAGYDVRSISRTERTIGQIRELLKQR
jgi:copper chaperone CopZ